MSNYWTTIGEVANVYDGPHATPKKVEHGPIFLGIASLNQGSLDLSQSAHISEEDFVKWTRRVTPKEGDVVFSYETRLGEAAIIPSGIQCCLGRRLGLLRPKRDKVIPEYLLYAYLAPVFQEVIKTRTIHGSTVDRIALKDLPNFPIQIPPIRDQLQVVDVLRNLNNKIELNRQINQTLEQIAQAIYKSWFIDFEPVKAKIAAKQNGQDSERAAMCAISGKTDTQLDQLIPNQRQQLATTAALFPDELVDSELGEIPKGWRIYDSSSLFEVKDGTHDSPKQAAEGYPLVTSRHITTGVIDFANTYLISSDDFEQINKRSKVDSLDILLTMIGTVGESLLVQQKEINFAIKNVGLFKTSQNSLFAVYFYLLLRSPKVKHYLESRMAGTTQKYLTLKILRSIPVMHPGDAILKEFNSVVLSMYLLINSNNEQIESLSESRDALLPRLLSGEITISEIEFETAVAV